MKILIVDADRLSRVALERHLRGWNHEVVCAEDGGAALSLLESDPSFGLLIADWVKPTIDGLELCRRARQLKRQRYLPILLLTSRSGKADRVDGLNVGADAFLTKPLSIPELQAVINVMERMLVLEGKLAQQLRTLEEAYARIEELVHTDDLTRLPNRRSILEHLDRETSRATRYGTAVSVVIFDIDHLKAVNDTHGLPVGDVVLRKVAELLVASIRGSDIVGRFGSEQFLAIFPGIGRDEAMETAGRLLAEIEVVDIPIGPQSALRVTLSAGVAEFDRNADDSRSLLTRADRALFQAKESGRNRACS